MKSRQQIAKCIERLGTDSAFEVFAKAKKLEQAGEKLFTWGLVNQTFGLRKIL